MIKRIKKKQLEKILKISKQFLMIDHASVSKKKNHS